MSELKEQCTLEQQAKAHLEQELRSDLEEKDHKITALQTKVRDCGFGVRETEGQAQQLLCGDCGFWLKRENWFPAEMFCTRKHSHILCIDYSYLVLNNTNVKCVVVLSSIF